MTPKHLVMNGVFPWACTDSLLDEKNINNAWFFRWKIRGSLREIKWFIQDHTAGTWYSEDSNSGLLYINIKPFYCISATTYAFCWQIVKNRNSFKNENGDNLPLIEYT